MKHHVLSLALVSAALALGASPASAVTIDFESLITVTGQLVPSSYIEDGFTLFAGSPNGFFAFGTADSNFSGSTALHNTTVGGVTELTLTGGGPFSLNSIDLAELNGNNVVDVSFIGEVAGGGVIAQTFTLNGIAPGAQTFTFPSFIGWDNVTKVSWSQDSPLHQFDNIVVNSTNGTAVPEPASLGLLGLGLAGLALIRRGVQQQRG